MVMLDSRIQRYLNLNRFARPRQFYVLCVQERRAKLRKSFSLSHFSLTHPHTLSPSPIYFLIFIFLRFPVSWKGEVD